MLIDWFTVVAQIVNFLVLVALLKHFLYGRLLRAIDDREAKIAARVAEADQKNQAAEQRMQEMKDKIQETEQLREHIISDARNDADEQRKVLVEKARASARNLEDRWREDLDREKGVFLDELRRRAASEILSVTRRALSDLACADVQHCAIQNFLEKIGSIELEKLKVVAAGDLSVQTASGLSPETEHQIQQALEDRVKCTLHIRFERNREIAWGLELRGNGQRIGWNPGAYLDVLESRLKETLDQRSEARYPTAVG